MKTIEKIRQKIEELYDGEAPAHNQQCEFEDGYFTGIATISNFLDSLSEEPDKDLPLPEDTLIFRKGVEEGRRLEREDIEKEWLEDRGGCFLDGVNEGKKAMKKQMMKEAVEGEVVKDISNKLAVTAKINLDGFKFGDKVRIIIVKED